MTTENKAVVRMYQAGDGPAINDCFNRVFNKDRPYQVWKWRYEDNPGLDREMPVAIAIDGDRVVGQYAGAPTYICVHGERKVACQTLDNFIEKDYRKARGLQKEMFQAAHSFAEEQNFDIGYGYPNPTAYKVGKKLLGYHDIVKMKPYFLRTNILQCCVNRKLPGTRQLATIISQIGSSIYRRKIAKQLPQPPSDIDIQYVARFSADVEELWQDLRARYPICAERTQQYLNWRYADRPCFDYYILEARKEGKLLAYMTFRLDEREPFKKVGYICDFVFQEDEMFTYLLRSALLKLISRQADYVQIISSDETRIQPLFRQCGFTNVEFLSEIPLVYNELAYHNPQALSHGPNWYITYGDTEIT